GRHQIENGGDGNAGAVGELNAPHRHIAALHRVVLGLCPVRVAATAKVGKGYRQNLVAVVDLAQSETLGSIGLRRLQTPARLSLIPAEANGPAGHYQTVAISFE